MLWRTRPFADFTSRSISRTVYAYLSFTPELAFRGGSNICLETQETCLCKAENYRQQTILSVKYDLNRYWPGYAPQIHIYCTPLAWPLQRLRCTYIHSMHASVEDSARQEGQVYRYGTSGKTFALPIGLSTTTLCRHFTRHLEVHDTSVGLKFGSGHACFLENTKYLRLARFISNISKYDARV